MEKGPVVVRLFLAAQVALVFVPLASHAQQQGGRTSVPLNYDRVHQAEQVTIGGHYLIGAVVPATSQFRLMQTADVNGQFRKSIGLSTFDREQGGEIAAEKVGDRVWQISPATNGRVVVKTADGRYLRGARGSENATALMLSATDSTLWMLRDEGDGTFSLSHDDKGQVRYVTLYEFNAQSHYYGCYTAATPTDSKRLMFYRGRTEVDVGKMQPAPADLSSVAIATTHVTQMTVAKADGSAADGSALLLTDGTVAPDERLGQWTIQRQTDSTFVLRDTAGAYLDAQFATQEQPCLWSLREAGLATVGDDVRLAVLDGGRFTAVLPHEAVGKAAATLMPVGQAPNSSEEAGTLSLQGAWSADALAALSWTTTTTLDLTSIALPQAPHPFSRRPQDRSTYILVAAGQAAVVPDAWTMTLACDAADPEADAVLLTPTILADRQALVPPRAFRYAAGQLGYRRQAAADGGWETLCLPFEAAVPAGFTVEAYEDYDAGTLSFRHSAGIEAHRAYLLCHPFAAATEGPVFEVTASAEGRIAADESPVSAVFSGTYVPLDIQSAAEGIYLLNAEGTAFVRAAAGSRLAPYRAALRLDGQKTVRLRVTHGAQPDGIPHATDAAETATDDQPLYDLTGRRVSRPQQGRLYISRGHKVVCTGFDK